MVLRMERCHLVPPPTVFRGADAVAAGLVTRAQLSGPRVQRVIRGVYAPPDAPRTHALVCAATASALPATAVITGRSAATLRGIALARADDPVDVLLPHDVRVTRTGGVAVCRTAVDAGESTGWGAGRVATPARTALDLLLRRPLPDAVADLDAVVRAGLVPLDVVRDLVAGRTDRGIATARRAVELADPRAESRPESRMRVRLVLAGLRPEVQYWISGRTGRLVRADLAFPEQRVAVEYDGGWRDGELWALNRDRERLNLVHAEEWDVVFVTAPLLHQHERMVRTVCAALDRRR